MESRKFIRLEVGGGMSRSDLTVPIDRFVSAKKVWVALVNPSRGLGSWYWVHQEVSKDHPEAMEGIKVTFYTTVDGYETKEAIIPYFSEVHKELLKSVGAWNED